MNNNLKLAVSVASVLVITMLLAAVGKAESLSVKTVECTDGTFEIVNDTLSCVSCEAGFTPQNRTCILTSQAKTTQKAETNLLQKFVRFIDEKGASITPYQPIIGRGILFIGSILIVVVLFRTAKKMLQGGKK